MAIDEETLKAFSGVYDIAQPSPDRVVTLDHMREGTRNPLLDRDDVCAVVQINARGGEGPYAVSSEQGAAIRDTLFDGITPGVDYTRLTGEQAFDDEAARRIVDDYRERGWDTGEFWIDDARLVIAAAPGYGTAAGDFELLNDWAAGDVYEIREYHRHEWHDDRGSTMSTWDQTDYLGDMYLGGGWDWTTAFDENGGAEDTMPDNITDTLGGPLAAYGTLADGAPHR
ncbi:hypothetical protein E5991_09345 [Bifidobacterium pseudolongum]|uniref:Uncharacterized protein n=1 Tax=Bifidobacterium pseudolongum TaxID=1694 RepID=A0A4S4F3E6_9BIFI|nr:hypothetical protein [Bifidobacterium pseudolongum]THG24049.1 hypothetical protein E5991_09345 [Bifidobacterium pseudolongum]